MPIKMRLNSFIFFIKIKLGFPVNGVIYIKYAATYQNEKKLMLNVNNRITPEQISDFSLSRLQTI